MLTFSLLKDNEIQESSDMFLMMCEGKGLLQMLPLPLNVLLLFLKPMCTIVVMLLRQHDSYIKWQMGQRQVSENSHMGNSQKYTVLTD